MTSSERDSGGSKRHTLILVPAYVLPGVAAFVGMLWIGSEAGLATVGYLNLSRIAATFGAALMANGPAMAALRAIAGGDPTRLPAFRGAMLGRLARLVPPIALVTGVVYAIAPDIGLPLLWAIPLLIAESMFVFEADVLRYEHRFARSSALSVTRSIVTWGSAALVASAGAGLQPIIMTYIATGTVTTLCFRWPRVVKVDELTRSELSRIWGATSALNIAGYALNNGDQYLIQMIAGPASVAVYALGYQLGGGAVNAVGMPLAGAISPRIVREWHLEGSGPPQATATARRAALVMLGSGIVITACLAVAGQFGILDHLTEASDFAFVAAVIALASSINLASSTAYSSLLFAQDRMREISGCSWVTVGISAIVVPLLTWYDGVRGTAIATLIAYVLLAIMLRYLARRTDL